MFSGNPDLDAEESESLNLGVVWQATNNMSFTLDYWSIEQDNKIAAGDSGSVYVKECNNQNSTVCIRAPALPNDQLGELSRINNGYFNLNQQSTSGIDFSADYNLSTDSIGSIKFKFDWTYMLDFEQKIEKFNATTQLPYLQEYDWTGEYEYPEVRWVASADWNMDNWGALASFSYIGEFEDTPINFDSGEIQINENKGRTIKAFKTLDLQVRYMGFENTLISFGVQNLLDKEPPFAIGDGDGDLYGYVSQVHSPRGQFVYGKVTYRF